MTLEHPTHQRTSSQSPPDRLKALKHRRADILVAAFEDALIARWGAFKARRNHTLISLVDALLRHGDFAEGGRVAYPIEKLARRFRKHVRTVEDAVAKLRQFPDLVHVLRIERGAPDWRGRTSRVTHLEWELGSLLRNAAQLEGVPPGVTAPFPPQHTGASPGNTPPDLPLASSIDLTLKLNAAPDTASHIDRRNFEVDPSYATFPIQPAAELPLPPPTKLQSSFRGAISDPALPSLEPAARPQARPQHQRPPVSARVTAAATGLAPTSARDAHTIAPRQPPSAGVLHHSIELIEEVIRQHRRIAEGKGPFVPIDDGERCLVDGALCGLTWCGTEKEQLDLCARVSELARAHAAQNGRVANLTYTFGGLDDRPQKHFLQRVAILREHDERALKELNDGELAASLLGLRRPVRPSPLPIAHRPGRIRNPGVARRGPPATPVPLSRPLSKEETLASIAQCQAALERPGTHASAG